MERNSFNMERMTSVLFLLQVLFPLLLMRIDSSQSHSISNSTSTDDQQECNKFLNKPLETIYSPDYPNASPLSRTCSWEIHAKPDKFVAVQLMEMNVGESDWDCTKGYLEIYDGCGENHFLVDKICSSRYQNDQRYLWVSTGSCVVIKFNSAGGTKNKFYLKTRETSFSCNKVLHTQPNGTFSNPDFLPLERQECTWVIAVPRNRIELKFEEEFHIQSNDGECKDDLLTVQNGRFSSSPLKETYCGNTRPYPVSATYGDMRIILKTSGRTSGSRNIFKAVYYMKEMHEDSTTQPSNCGSPVLLKAPHASFVSPGYPVQYPPNVICVWLIEVKPGLKILLRFKDFDVESDNHRCIDYVQIFDGLASWSPSKGRYCGRDLPPVLKSETNKLRLVFKSNSRYAGRGFKAIYSDYNPADDNSSSNSSSHFTGIMIGTTCGIIFIVLSMLAVFHARKRRLRRAMEQCSDMASTISFDVHQANAPPSYETVMASPNLYPTPKGESDLTCAYKDVPSLHHEVCHLLGSNPDSEDEEPPPTYRGLFGDEGDVQANGPIGGQFIVEYHPRAPQGEQAEGINNEVEKNQCEPRPGRVWHRRDYDHLQGSIYLAGSLTGTLERQDTCSSFVTDV